MHYVYDVILNFNEYLYDIYDWNEEDNIDHIRKIPILKVDNLKEIKENVIQISQQFLEYLYNKTEVFYNRSYKKVESACLISDGVETIALKFNRNGKSFLYSRLIIDEEAETLFYFAEREITDFEYQIIKIKKYNEFKTRLENKLEKYILEEISKLKKNNELEKLQYLYFEISNKKINDINVIYEKIKEQLTNNWDSVYNRVYSFLMMCTKIV